MAQDARPDEPGGGRARSGRPLPRQGAGALRRARWRRRGRRRRGPGRRGTSRCRPGHGRARRGRGRPARRRAARAAARCRSAARSTPSNSLLDISPPTRPMARTGRSPDAPSSGSTSAQRADHRLAAVPAQRRASRARPGRPPGRRRRRRARAGRRRCGLARRPRTTRWPAGAAPATCSGRSASRWAPQDVGEQVVVAVPAALVVQRHHEQVPALQRLEHLAAPGRLGDGVAQRAGEPVEDRGAEQEVADAPRAGGRAPPRPGSRRRTGRRRRTRR